MNKLFSLKYTFWKLNFLPTQSKISLDNLIDIFRGILTKVIVNPPPFTKKAIDK